MQALEMRPKVQIRAFNLPRIVLSDTMLRRRNGFRVTLPIVRIIHSNRKNGQLLNQPRAHVIAAFADLVRYNATTSAIHRVPRPALIRFSAHNAPELIGFGAELNVKRGRGRLPELVGKLRVHL